MTVDYDIIVKGNNLRLKDGFLGLANATLVFSADGPLLFDVGHQVNRPALLAGLKRHGMTPQDVRAVFLSHLHFDHCYNIDLFPQAKVHVSRREWDYAAHPHADDPFVPWLIREQLRKHDLELLDGEGRIGAGIEAIAVPGHTPGSYGLVLDTGAKGRVVLAGDAIKYAKEALTRRCDMAFDTLEAGSASIARILELAERIVPGHFPELIRQEDGGFIWNEAAEFALLVR
ncbi:MAG: MBL fold metallo-hydrolase [Kiloniellales bacterium]|jgi:glyoxylase-like metal-dependent hydrolase (beta-lactamase superfamily II)